MDSVSSKPGSERRLEATGRGGGNQAGGGVVVRRRSNLRLEIATNMQEAPS